MPRWDLRFDAKVEGENIRTRIRSRFSPEFDHRVSAYISKAMKRELEYQRTKFAIERMKVGNPQGRQIRFRPWLANAIAKVKTLLKYGKQEI